MNIIVNGIMNEEISIKAIRALRIKEFKRTNNIALFPPLSNVFSIRSITEEVYLCPFLSFVVRLVARSLRSWSSAVIRRWSVRLAGRRGRKS